MVSFWNFLLFGFLPLWMSHVAQFWRLMDHQLSVQFAFHNFFDVCTFVYASISHIGHRHV